MILFPAIDLKEGLAVFEIDRRKQNHGFHFKKFAISARPSFWLFSG